MILKALIVAINHVGHGIFVFDWIILIVNWSGRRESNPHTQLGKLVFYH